MDFCASAGRDKRPVIVLILAPLPLVVGCLAIPDSGGGDAIAPRNAVYTSLLGMLPATGFDFADWRAVAAATLMYVFGTEIRIAAEEAVAG